jgi:putative hydrolase of HD superfamily
MPTDTKPGVRPLADPCWTLQDSNGLPAYDEYEPHYLTEAEGREAAANYGFKDGPKPRVVQLEKACWTATLLCGELFVYDGDDSPAVHFEDEADLLTAMAEDGLFCVKPGVFTCNTDDCAVCLPYAIPRRNKHLAARMVDLGYIALAFGRVERATFHPGGKRHETDTDHTVMLGLVACALASEFFPELSVGLVAQLILVHDLHEVYAGDTNTLRLLGVQATAGKEQRERAATNRLHAELSDAYPWVAHAVRSYQAQDTAEKVFVWAVDKLIAKTTHILDHGAAFRAEGMTVAELTERFDRQRDEIRERAAQFPMLADLHAILVGQAIAVFEADQ